MYKERAVHLDFETYSACDIRAAGAYRYARHHTTEALICAYWLPDMDRALDAPLVWLPRVQAMPADLKKASKDKDVTFYAHNVQFERAIWHHALKRQHPRDVVDIPVERWMCTAALAAANGLARSLDMALKMLGTGVEKDSEGARLIKIFCKPRKPTKKDPRVRILPEDAPADFRKFVRYCQRDVLGEMELHDQLPPLNPEERAFFHLDIKMNERGLPIDLPLVRTANTVLKVLESRIAEEVQRITGGVRATQREKMLDVFQGMGLDLENLQAQTVKDVLESRGADLPDNVKRLLLLRVEAGKASTKKLASMLACTDPDDHVVQGGFLFHGAHTGRYAGRLIQPQNFIRGSLKPHQQEIVFAALALGDPDLLEMLYEWPIDTISQCMRGFIQAPEGHRFVVVDYTAIEARVLAWVANERNVLANYHKGLDVYKVMASRLFGVPVEQVDTEQRRIAKNLVLGCGYGLGGVKFVDYCAAAGVTITEAFAKKAVALYREEHPAIVASWKLAEDAMAAAIRKPGSVHEAVRCKFFMRKQWLCIALPSGREIRYFKPKAVPVERWGKPAYQISYYTTFRNSIIRETTYGGKIIENIVQALARDVMREGMFAAEEAGYPVHGTVHDELLTIRPNGQGSHKELEKVVCQLKPWMKGIPLNSEGFETRRYRKG